MTAATGMYLAAYLAPLRPYLEREDVTDIYVNRPGELWIEATGGTIERHDAPALDEKSLLRLARQIASSSHQGINRSQPLLSARLPGGERIQFVLPPATREGPALAIRKFARSGLNIGHYSTDSSAPYTKTEHNRADLRRGLRETLSSEGHEACLRMGVASRANILISGGTSTGKTTFLNALLAEVENTDRLILIEDAAELHATQPNCVGLLAVRGKLGEADVTANDLVTASLRLRPERIIIGELRGEEAFAFLRAVNSGHPGSMTTIHADSPRGARSQLSLLGQSSGMSADAIRALATETIDLYVQLKRQAGSRRISDIIVGDDVA
jgi:type IV secretion system protein VirB11